MRTIILTGFMGTGKSSAGKHLAKELGGELIDTDEWIEKTEGRKISDIFKRDGESAFRALEKAALARILARPGVIVTTGGGTVIDADNRRLMRERGFVIALTATPETILERVSRSRHRPLLETSGGDKLSEIRRLLQERRSFYADCDMALATDGMTPHEMAAVIIKNLQEKGVL